MGGDLDNSKRYCATPARHVPAYVVADDHNIADYEERLRGFLAQQADVHFHQTFDWYRSGGSSQDLFFVLTLSDGDILASSLVRRRRLPGLPLALYKVERGPVAPDATSLRVHLEQLVDALRGDAVLIAVSPFRQGDPAGQFAHELGANGWTPSPRQLAPYETTIVLDLSRGVDELRAGLRRSLKTQLNRGSRLGVEVRRATDADSFNTFVRQHNEMARRRGLAGIPPRIAGNLRDHCVREDGLVQLFVASCEGGQIAGICLLSGGNRVIYEWGVSSEATAHRHIPLTHLLHWRAVQWAAHAGYRYYDFGGYWEERGDADPINRFKTGFSKEKQHFVPEHVFRVRPMLARTWQTAARLRAGVWS